MTIDIEKLADAAIELNLNPVDTGAAIDVSLDIWHICRQRYADKYYGGNLAYLGHHEMPYVATIFAGAIELLKHSELWHSADEMNRIGNTLDSIEMNTRPTTTTGDNS